MERRGLIGVLKARRPKRAVGVESTGSSPAADSLVLIQAALLARMARLEQSEAVLLALAERPQPSTTALDLLAKVLAQQGKLDEAQSLWIRALQKEPSNRHILRALMRCAQLQGKDSREVLAGRLLGLISGCTVVCGIVVAVVGLAGFHWWR